MLSGRRLKGISEEEESICNFSCLHCGVLYESSQTHLDSVCMRPSSLELNARLNLSLTLYQCYTQKDSLPRGGQDLQAKWSRRGKVLENRNMEPCQAFLAGGIVEEPFC